MINAIRQRFNNIKFRYKIMLVYICIGFLPLLVVTLLMFNRFNYYVSRQEQMTTNNMVSQAVTTLDNDIKIYDNLSDYISFDEHIANVIMEKDVKSYEFYENLTETLDSMINSFQYFHTDIVRITVYARDDIVAHGTTLRPITDIEGEPWFYRAKQATAPMWIVDRDKKEAFSVRSMPAIDRNKGLGILCVQVDYDDLMAPFESISISNGGILVEADDELVFENSVFDRTGIGLHLTLDQIRDNAVPDSYHLIQNTTFNGWVAYYYYSDLVLTNSRLRQLVMFALAVIAMSLVMAAIALLSTSQTLVGRIEKLQENVKLVEEGHLEVTVTSEDRDEIGTLIRGFGLMINRIKFLIEEVYEANLSQKSYEMRALQQQINPHFLYNTLSMINFMAMEEGQHDICKVTLALSDFYRTSLNKGRNTCTLEDELKNMNAYLDIQLMMHDYSFDLDIQFDETMRHYESLNLILQPVVENALNHGIDLLEDRRGLIKIYATATEHEVYVMVEDNGVGMDQETVDKMLAENSKGYGMRNVNERIKLYYGDEYGVYIESVPGEGTVVTIKQPKRIYVPEETLQNEY